MFGDVALLFIRGEAATVFFATSVVGGGNDRVTLSNVQFAVGAIDDFNGFIIDTGSGNDRLEITDSAAGVYIVNLGDGDDRLTFTNNFIGNEFHRDGRIARRRPRLRPDHRPRQHRPGHPHLVQLRGRGRDNLTTSSGRGKTRKNGWGKTGRG